MRQSVQKIQAQHMNYRHLGKAGIQVSELSLGSWVSFHTQFGVEEAATMMAAA